MKITAIEPLLCRFPVQHRKGVPHLAGVPRRLFDMLLVRVTTDTGLVGWGEAFAHYQVWDCVRTAISTVIAPHCIGREVSDLNGLTQSLERQLHPIGRTGPLAYGWSGIEMALWDLTGKALQLPVHRLLGGAQVDRVRTYASLPRYGSVAAVVNDCDEALARGFDAVKIHEIGVAEIRASAERLARRHGTEFMIDANCPWTLEEALQVAGQIGPEPRVKWLEEPLIGPDDYAGLAELRRRSGLPIAVGENAGSVSDFETMVRCDAVDFVQPSVAKIGGIGALRRVWEMSRDSAVEFAPHTPFLGPALIASVHVCAALAPDTRLESYFLDTPGNPFGAFAVPQGGVLPVPQGHGLGCDPDPALLAQWLCP